MKKESGFRLNGKPLNVRQVPPMVGRLVAIASKLPNDELLDLPALMSQLACSRDTLKKSSMYEDALPYRATIMNQSRKILVFGNAATIKKLLKGLEGA